jgi:hypothetical protein
MFDGTVPQLVSWSQERREVQMPRTRMPQAITFQRTPSRSRRRGVPDEIAASTPVNGVEAQLKVAWRTALSNAALNPLQQALVDHDVFWCGYCASGQVCLTAGVIAEGKAKHVDEIREPMSRNICRCTAYLNIFAVIQQGMEQA